MSDEDRQKLTEYCKNKFYSMIKKKKKKIERINTSNNT